MELKKDQIIYVVRDDYFANKIMILKVGKINKKSYTLVNQKSGTFEKNSFTAGFIDRPGEICLTLVKRYFKFFHTYESAYGYATLQSIITERRNLEKEKENIEKEKENIEKTLEELENKKRKNRKKTKRTGGKK